MWVGAAAACGGNTASDSGSSDSDGGASGQRAINSAYLEAYEAHPEWQVFDDPDVCAMIGLCMDDSQVESAACSGAPDGTCELVFPG